MVVGNRLNHTGSNTPQIMEDIAGEFHYGAMIRSSDGGVTAFKCMRPPPPGADPSDVTDFITARTTSADVVSTIDLWALGWGNPLWLPVASWDALPNGYDDHFSVSVGVDYLDRVWISGNSRMNFVDDTNHSGGLHWVRYDPALGDFDDPASWTSPAVPAVYLNCGQNLGATYHHYRRLSNGTLLAFFSQIDDPGGESRGREFTAFYLNSTTAGTWQPLITNSLPAGADKLVDGVTNAPSPAAGGHFCQCSGSPNANINNDVSLFTSPPNRAYINAIYVEKLSETVDRVHVMGCWRTANTDGRSSQQPWYIYCDNPVGNSNGWKTITGASQPMPIAWTATVDNRHPTATIIGPGTVQRAYSGAIAIDDNGYPHFIMSNGAGGLGDSPEIFKPDTTVPFYAESVYTNPTSGDKYATMHVWWDGTAWQKEGLPAINWGFSGGPLLVHIQGMLLLMDSHDPGKIRVKQNPFQLTPTDYFVIGVAPRGSEPNPDPVSLMQRGQLALMLPEDDIPKVFWWGDNDDLLPNAAAMNTNPGP